MTVYAQNKLNWYPNLLERSDEMNARYRNPDNDPRGVWKSVDSTAQAGHGTKSQFYVVTAPNGKQHTLPNGRCWLYTEPVLLQMIADNRIWFGADGNNVPAVKRFLSEVKQGTACQTIWKYVDVGHNQEAKKEVNNLFPESSVFDTPKPSRLIKRILQLSTDKDDIVLDFFSGSCTAAHAVLDLNKQDNGNRKFIMVQLPEPCDENSEAFKAGYKTIADIGKERIRRVIKKIETEQTSKAKENAGTLPGMAEASPKLDLGFKVFKLDKSNFKLWDGADTDISEEKLARQLELHIDHINPKASPEDVLYELLLKAGFKPTEKVVKKKLAGKTVFSIADGGLLICLEDNITRELIDAVAEAEPFRFICLDRAFNGNDQLKANAVQTFEARNQGRDKAQQIVFRTV